MSKMSNNIFFTFTSLYRKTYILLKSIFEETQFILLYSHRRFFTWQVIGNAVTPTSIQIFIGFLDTLPRSKIPGKRLRILTQILIAMDYFFYLYISDKYLQFREKSILIWAINFIIKGLSKGIEILAKCLFSFSIIVFSMKLLVVLFVRKRIICQRILLVHPIQVTPDVPTAGLFFKQLIPQRYVHSLERYWKNSVCTSVKNFANL